MEKASLLRALVFAVLVPKEANMLRRSPQAIWLIALAPLLGATALVNGHENRPALASEKAAAEIADKLSDLDRQIEAKEKELTKLRKKADLFRAKVGLGRTWVEVDGKRYGATPDARGLIGGGTGYNKVVTKGDYRVATLDELLKALKQAKKGEVIFVDGSTELDCTHRVHIEKLVLEIPAGVTLASNRGHGASSGALIFSDTFTTSPLIRAMGPEVRVTGLRLRGPEPNRRPDHYRRTFIEGRGRDYYYKFPTSDGIVTNHPGLALDNCELSAWSHAAVFLVAGDGHSIHHNFMHHCQYDSLGYGVCLDRAFCLIEYNVFNWNRHSIAGTGTPDSGYEARNNVVLETSLGHDFDMHGGEDRGDGTDIAGKWIRIHHNTFYGRSQAVVFRGVPREGAEVYGNWFSHEKRDAVSARAKTRVFNNAYGSTKPRLLDPAP